MKKIITAIGYEIELWRKYKPFQEEIEFLKMILTAALIGTGLGFWLAVIISLILR